MNRTSINSTQSIFFWNITRRQAISPVAKFHHVLRRGFMIQRVILIAQVAECEANQHNPGLELVLMQYSRPEGLDGGIHAKCSNNSGIYTYSLYN